METLITLIFYLVIFFSIKNFIKKNSEKSKKEKWIEIKKEHENKLKNATNKSTVEEGSSGPSSKPTNSHYRKNESNKNIGVKRTKKSKVSFGNYFKSINDNNETKDGNNYYKIKGELGEKEIIKELECFKVYHRILSNLYIPHGRGVTEVDIVLITYTGIYVIESKNYKGWIFGREIDNKWTQMFSKESKFQFYNPIKQNLGHIGALHSVLRRNNIHNKSYPYISYIIFGNECELKSIDVSSAKVFNLYSLYETLWEDVSKRQSEFTKEDIDNIYNFLKQYTEVSEFTKKRHERTIQKAKDYSKRGGY